MQRHTVGAEAMARSLAQWPCLEHPAIFSNGTLTLLAQGLRAELQQALPFSAIADSVEAFLHRAKRHPTDNPIALGVIPFHDQQACRFVIPERIDVSTRLRPELIPDHSKVPSVASVTSQPDAEGFKHAVELALEELSKGSLKKAVMGRRVDIQFEQPWASDQLVMALLKQNPRGFTFSLPLPGGPNDHALVGSSPELLVRRQGDCIEANPLAGSRKRSASDIQDQHLADQMLESEKDLEEHAIVVRAMETVLSRHCTTLDVPWLPSVMSTPTMLHLSTWIRGRASSSASALRLAMELHPTPAICGYPVPDAYRFLAEHEPFDRRCFAGLVGWCDARGQGEWAVVIRSAEVEPTGLRVFAGAGLVPGSDPSAEFLETGHKMRTVLSAALLPTEYAFAGQPTDAPSSPRGEVA